MFEVVPVELIKDATNRAPDQIDQLLVQSIQKFGLLNPIWVDRDYNLIAGQRRLLAVKSLGLKTIYVWRQQ